MVTGHWRPIKQDFAEQNRRCGHPTMGREIGEVSGGGACTQAAPLCGQMTALGQDPTGCPDWIPCQRHGLLLGCPLRLLLPFKPGHPQICTVPFHSCHQLQRHLDSLHHPCFLVPPPLLREPIFLRGFSLVGGVIPPPQVHTEVEGTLLWPRACEEALRHTTHPSVRMKQLHCMSVFLTNK